MGRLPDEGTAEQSDLDERVALLGEIGRASPTGEEVLALLPLFPADDSTCFGLAWTLLHIIEASPERPIWDALDRSTGEWPDLLRLRLQNAGVSARSPGRS
jgi:hypothetical protein